MLLSCIIFKLLQFLQRGYIAYKNCSNSLRVSVCPSVTRWYCTSRRMKTGSCCLHGQIPINSSFLTSTLVGGEVPFHQKLRLKCLPSEKLRFRPISAYNVSTVRSSEKSSIIANRKSTTRFRTSYRRNPYVTLNSYSKSEFGV